MAEVETDPANGTGAIWTRCAFGGNFR